MTQSSPFGRDSGSKFQPLSVRGGGAYIVAGFRGVQAAVLLVAIRNGMAVRSAGYRLLIGGQGETEAKPAAR